MDTPKKTYRKTDPDNPARKHFAQLYATGDPDKGIKPNNGTRSYMEAFPGTKPDTARAKAPLLLANDSIQLDIEQQRKKLEALSGKGIQRMAEYLDDDATDKRLAFDIGKFAAEQTHGKATQKVETVGVFVNVTMPLTPGSKPPQEVIDALKDD